MNERSDTLSNQNPPYIPQQAPVSIPPTDTRLPSNVFVHNSETWETCGSLSGIIASTAFFNYEKNVSFELSHGPVTIQRVKSSDFNQSYIVLTNLILNNTGSVPIEVTFATIHLKNEDGDGFVSGLIFNRGVLFLGPQNKSVNYVDHWLDPGKSDTQILNLTFNSSKSLDNLVSQKFELEGAFDISWKVLRTSTNPYGISGSGGDRRSWLIDLNKTD
jgi:hypothetical protein